VEKGVLGNPHSKLGRPSLGGLQLVKEWWCPSPQAPDTTTWTGADLGTPMAFEVPEDARVVTFIGHQLRCTASSAWLYAIINDDFGNNYWGANAGGGGYGPQGAWNFMWVNGTNTTAWGVAQEYTIFNPTRLNYYGREFVGHGFAYSGSPTPWTGGGLYTPSAPTDNVIRKMKFWTSTGVLVEGSYLAMWAA
jgi:hypothetical protein